MLTNICTMGEMLFGGDLQLSLMPLSGGVLEALLTFIFLNALGEF